MSTERESAVDPGPEIGNIPLLDDAIDHAPELEKKPKWRGWIHAGTFPLAIAAGIVLIVLSDGVPAKVASAVFMASSLLLFGISAIYHRFNWSPKVKAVFRRLDHSNIFLLIAGTYTPLAIDALEPPKSWILLSIIWGGAILGILSRIFWLRAPRWSYVVLYVALGWAAMLYIVDLVNANVATMVLVLVGGVSYTVGAMFYAFKRPNPVPGVFGFHELFHSCTVIAFMCHWTGILLIAMNPVAG
jgi:hemolysin III